MPLKPLRSFIVAFAAASIFASSALAHFVWIETKPTDAGLLVRSGFGEIDGWDPDFVDRMANSTFWVRSGTGLKPLSLPLDKKEAEYRTTVADAQANAVLGATDYGIIAFGKSPPSHLRYTAKSLVGLPADWNDAKPTAELRIEVLAKLDGKNVALQVLHLGKPLAAAKIKARTPAGDAVELLTDDQGKALWPTAGAGHYSLYVGTTTNTAGELNGKKFEALKDYATLTFVLP